MPAPVDAPATDRRRGRRVRRGSRRSLARVSTPARRATAAELRPTTQGPTVQGTDYVDLATEGGQAAKELSTEEVDRLFRRLDAAIVACIDRARGEVEVLGQVTVSLRIERSGRVEKVQVTAPALLQRGEIYACIRPLVTGLRFAPSGRALIMSYPFDLR